MEVVCLWGEESLPYQVSVWEVWRAPCLNLQPNPASLGQIVEGPFSFACIAQGFCGKEFEI